MKSARNFYNGLLLLASFVFALLIGEAALRLFSTDEYYVWPPNLEMTFRPSPGVMPGISGESRFVINELGIRGESFSEGDSTLRSVRAEMRMARCRPSRASSVCLWIPPIS